jgi:hypothetical protein
MIFSFNIEFSGQLASTFVALDELLLLNVRATVTAAAIYTREIWVENL